MLENYTKCLTEVLRLGLRPTVTKFSGVMWHGTGMSQAKAACRDQIWKPNPEWFATWIGPAAYGFLAKFPQFRCDPSIPDQEEDCGRWAAGRTATYKVEKNLCAPPPAILQVTVECERLMDLDSPANDEFIATLKKLVSRVPVDHRAWFSEALKPAFVGKLIHWQQELLEEECRPQAYAVEFPVDETGDSQRGLAVVDAGAIVGIEIV